MPIKGTRLLRFAKKRYTVLFYDILLLTLVMICRLHKSFHLPHNCTKQHQLLKLRIEPN